MSMQMRFGRPASCASASAPMLPPTGPESSVWIGIARGRRRGHGAAVRFHDVEVAAAGQPVGKLRDQRVEIAAHHRRDIGVHYRRRGAGELAPLLRDAMRERDRDARQARSRR